MTARIILTGLLILVSGKFAANNKDANSFYEHWNQGSAYFKDRGDWQKAFASAFNALHEASNNSKAKVESLTRIGNLFFYFRKSLGDAEGYYRKALQINPYYLDALIGSGDIYFSRNEFRGALHYYELAAKYNPQSYESFASIAAAMYELAEDEMAMHYYQKALEINPQDLVSLNNYANIFYDKKRMREARDIYLKCLSQDSQFTTAHNNLGNVYLSIKEYDEARKHFLKALELDFDDPSIHSNIANLYFELKLVERAKYHLRRAQYIQENPVFSNNLAVMEKFSNEELNAGIQYAKALKVMPIYSNARKNSGFFRKRSQTIAEAHKDSKDRFYLLKAFDGKARRQRKLRNQNEL